MPLTPLGERIRKDVELRALSRPAGFYWIRWFDSKDTDIAKWTSDAFNWEFFGEVRNGSVYREGFDFGVLDAVYRLPKYGQSIYSQ